MVNQSDRIGPVKYQLYLPESTMDSTPNEAKLCTSSHESEESSLLTKLRIDKLEVFGDLLKAGDELLIRELGSQGFFQSEDGTYASSHESTSSALSYYVKKLSSIRMPQGLNMDRGGIVARSDGGYSACIADGVSSDGYWSALTAQMMCYFLMKRALNNKITYFTEFPQQNKWLVENVFNTCATYLSQCSFGGTSCGATTALFVDCIPITDGSGQKMYRAQGGSLGDGAIIHICSAQKKATQLNTITRVMNSHGVPDVKDTGGCLVSSGKIIGLQKVSEFNVNLAGGDFLILVTDGFLDNVAENNVSAIVEIVMSSPLFDLPLDTLRNYPRFWEEKDPYVLPTSDELKKFLLDYSGESEVEALLTPAIITRRLANYVKLVTYNLFTFKDAKYTAQADALDTINRVTENACAEKVSEQDILLAKSVVTRVRKELYDCDKANIAKLNSPKVDDCMIITLKPGVEKSHSYFSNGLMS